MLISEHGNSRVRSLLIIAREHADLCEAFRRELGNHPEVEIILDRRNGDCGQPDCPDTEGQPSRDRRVLRSPEADLRQRHYLLTRPHDRCPSDSEF